VAGRLLEAEGATAAGAVRGRVRMSVERRPGGVDGKGGTGVVVGGGWPLLAPVAPVAGEGGGDEGEGDGESSDGVEVGAGAGAGAAGADDGSDADSDLLVVVPAAGPDDDDAAPGPPLAKRPRVG